MDQTAFVLMHVDPERRDRIAERLTRLPGVLTVHEVGGVYDLIATIQATSAEGIGNLVQRHMAKVDGVYEAETLASSRSFTRRDVDPLYAGGLGP
jgi:DNA-binding Lrp family transcriptional regulator